MPVSVDHGITTLVITWLGGRLLDQDHSSTALVARLGGQQMFLGHIYWNCQLENWQSCQSSVKHSMGC